MAKGQKEPYRALKGFIRARGPTPCGPMGAHRTLLWTFGDLLSGYQSPPGRLKTILDRTMQGPQAVVDTFVLDPFGPLQEGQKSCVVVPHPDEFEFYNRSPRPCPGTSKAPLRHL